MTKEQQHKVKNAEKNKLIKNYID